MTITGIINEEWRSVSGNANYQVSNIGRVRNVKTERILKPCITKDGYCQVGLCNNKSQKFLLIHRLVAQAFIENLDDKLLVDHSDRIKTNNYISNLRWATNSENAMNRKPHRNTSSKHKGVFFDKRDNKWRAQIMIDNKRTYLGYFSNEKEAAQRYNEEAIKLFGEFALINKIE